MASRYIFAYSLSTSDRVSLIADFTASTSLCAQTHQHIVLEALHQVLLCKIRHCDLKLKQQQQKRTGKKEFASDHDSLFHSDAWLNAISSIQLALKSLGKLQMLRGIQPNVFYTSASSLTFFLQEVILLFIFLTQVAFIGELLKNCDTESAVCIILLISLTLQHFTTQRFRW